MRYSNCHCGNTSYRNYALKLGALSCASGDKASELLAVVIKQIIGRVCKRDPKAGQCRLLVVNVSEYFPLPCTCEWDCLNAWGCLMNHYRDGLITKNQAKTVADIKYTIVLQARLLAGALLQQVQSI